MTTPSHKLTYSRQAYLRRIAMSYDKSIFIIVEGKQHDRYYVDRICRSSASIKAAGYEIRLISQIGQRGGYSGGKAAVLRLYDHCRRAQKLVQSNSGGARIICFFIDRDTQQVTGGMRRSAHVVYTLLPDVEAQIFADANEAEALGAAAALDADTTRMVVQSLGNWRRSLADAWRPWIEECYVAEAVRARCWVAVSHRSRIHGGPGKLVLDPLRLADARREVERTSLLESAEYAAKRKSILDKLQRYYLSDRQAELVKGKWLPEHLTWLIERFFSTHQAPGSWNSLNFNTSITRCYLANISETAGGFRALRSALEILLP